MARLGWRLLLIDLRTRLAERLIAWRQRGLNRLLSGLYGSPVVVASGGQAGLAAALVLWYLEGGVKHLVMLRNTAGDDTRARFISAYGLHGKAHMGDALLAAVQHSTGSMFMRTFKPDNLALDRVAAVPMFTATDDTTGLPTPVQALVWCVQLQPAQLELLHPPKGLALVQVPEFGLSSSQISPTHRSLFNALGRHLPKGKLPQAELTAQQIDDTLRPVGSSPRVVH
jgi:hypothetical protein